MRPPESPPPLRLIHSRAPIRICDNGGWTDTWFAGHGAVFNVAVSPFVEAQIAVYPRTSQEERVILNVENYGDRYAIDPDGREWLKHPLLEAAVARSGVPQDLACEISLYSEAPGGGATGTSAAVTVALLGALDCLTPGRMSPHELAYAAHAVETEMLGLQSGIQDQLCAAYGGINYIQMHAYPQATVERLEPPAETRWELEARLALIYLGESHSSSQVHETVIADLEGAGPDHPQLEILRRAAGEARHALLAGDFDALGRAMVANTEAQEELHPALVSADARRVIEIARRGGAPGWKVNGAGGEGGSLTLLCGPRRGAKRALLREIEAEDPRFEVIPIRLSREGLVRWETALT